MLMEPPAPLQHHLLSILSDYPTHVEKASIGIVSMPLHLDSIYLWGRPTTAGCCCLPVLGGKSKAPSDPPRVQQAFLLDIYSILWSNIILNSIYSSKNKSDFRIEILCILLATRCLGFKAHSYILLHRSGERVMP